MDTWGGENLDISLKTWYGDLSVSSLSCVFHTLLQWFFNHASLILCIHSALIRLCGGDIRVARGSRIDHAFREKQPYKMDGGAYQRNLARFAEAWLDEESIEKFYKVCIVSSAAFASNASISCCLL